MDILTRFEKKALSMERSNKKNSRPLNEFMIAYWPTVGSFINIGVARE